MFDSFATPWTRPPVSSVPWDSPDQSPGVGCRPLLQGISPWQADFSPLLSQQGSSGYRGRCGVFHNVILPILYPVLLGNPGLFPTTRKASSTLFSKLLAENQTLAVSSKKSRRDLGWCVPILFVFCWFPTPPDLLFHSFLLFLPAEEKHQA